MAYHSEKIAAFKSAYDAGRTTESESEDEGHATDKRGQSDSHSTRRAGENGKERKSSANGNGGKRTPATSKDPSTLQKVSAKAKQFVTGKWSGASASKSADEDSRPSWGFGGASTSSAKSDPGSTGSSGLKFLKSCSRYLKTRETHGGDDEAESQDEEESEAGSGEDSNHESGEESSNAEDKDATAPKKGANGTKRASAPAKGATRAKRDAAPAKGGKGAKGAAASAEDGKGAAASAEDGKGAVASKTKAGRAGSTASAAEPEKGTDKKRSLPDPESPAKGKKGKKHVVKVPLIRSAVAHHALVDHDKYVLHMKYVRSWTAQVKDFDEAMESAACLIDSFVKMAVTLDIEDKDIHTMMQIIQCSFDAHATEALKNGHEFDSTTAEEKALEELRKQFPDWV